MGQVKRNLPLGLLFLLSLIFLHVKIKDGGYSNMTDKQAAFAHPKYTFTAG